MIKKTITMLTITSLLFSSCSTTKHSMALGIASGAITGAGLGSAISNDKQGTLTGLAVGALVGGIASYLIDKGLEKRDQDTRQQTLFNLEKYGVFGDSELSSKIRMQEVRENVRDWSIPNYSTPTREPRDFDHGGRH